MVASIATDDGDDVSSELVLGLNWGLGFCGSFLR